MTKNSYDLGMNANGLIEMYRQMTLIRGMEDRILQLFKEGKIPASTHLCQGQEAVYVGVCSLLRPTDYVLGTYRGHGEAVAKGIPPREILAEILGKATGCCKGKGGSMHMSKKEIGMVGTFSIVAAGLPSAVGLGLSCKLRGNDEVVACFFGDGATNNGTFHESLNMAAVWDAPVIFVCINNLYAEYSPVSRTTKIEDLARRADSYAMPGIICDGNDLFSVRKTAEQAITRARNGKGPTLIECKTYRRGGHSRLDDGSTYRPKEEVETWFKKDPIVTLHDRLVHDKVLDDAKDQSIRNEIAKVIDEAVEYAIASPEPPIAKAFEDVNC